MKFKSLLVSTLVALGVSSIPALAFADVTIENKTNSYATVGSTTGDNRCSSAAGNKGISEPNKTVTISQIMLNLMCPRGECQAYVYASNNCTGSKLALVTLESKKGVTGIVDYKVDNFSVTGGSSKLTLAYTSGVMGFFKSIFN